MSDSLKLHSAHAESEACSYPTGLVECRWDELRSDSSTSQLNRTEGPPVSNGITNVQSLRSAPAQEFYPTNLQLSSERESMPSNLAGWEPRRTSGFYSSSPTYSFQPHVDSHHFTRTLPNSSTLQHAHVPVVPVAPPSIDCLPFPCIPQLLDPTPASPPSFIPRQHEHYVQGGSPRTPPSGDDGNFIPIPQPLLRNAYTNHSRISALPSPALRTSLPERDCVVISSHESALALDSDVGHSASVSRNSSPDISARRSPSDLQYYSGIDRALHQLRRGPRVRGWQITQATEEISRIPARHHSISRSPPLRSPHVSAGSRVLSPLQVGDTFSEDPDNLPALLSPSDGSEVDRPPSPDTAASTDSGSQVLSDNGRSRFLHPGTPIQTVLPELQSLLESYQTQSDSHRPVWVVPDDDVPPEHLDFQMYQDDDDITGDLQRAKELLEGLEQVDSELVKRYEDVRGDGHDICTVCRESLLLPEDRHEGDVNQLINSSTNWIHAANTALPFKPPPEGPSIHAFPCTHLFHTDCLIPWLCLKTTCPTCRLDIDPHSLTLRVRGWASSRWPQPERQERQYVNVDVLGRRIPWQRPPAASLQEWVERRENETPQQREQRLKNHTSPRSRSEPSSSPDWTHRSRQRAVSEPYSVEFSTATPGASLGLTISEPFEESESSSELLNGSRYLSLGADAGLNVSQEAPAIENPSQGVTNSLVSLASPSGSPLPRNSMILPAVPVLSPGHILGVVPFTRTESARFHSSTGLQERVHDARHEAEYPPSESRTALYTESTSSMRNLGFSIYPSRTDNISATSFGTEAS
ncbi:hypothetical protein K439DRAFT_1664523 [Ramaria rubella]|nr:hypothetical protein K439DRAFT_1664523 [Ramaria rubella]